VAIDAVTDQIKAQIDWGRGRGRDRSEVNESASEPQEKWDEFKKSVKRHHRKEKGDKGEGKELVVSFQPPTTEEVVTKNLAEPSVPVETTPTEVASDEKEISPEEKARKEKLIAFITKGTIPDDDRIVKEFKRFVHSFQVTERVGKKHEVRTFPAQTVSDLNKLFFKDQEALTSSGLSEDDEKAAFAEYLADSFEEWRKDPDFHLRVKSDKIKELSQVGKNTLDKLVSEWGHATEVGIRVVKEGDRTNATNVLRNMALIYPGGNLNLSIDWLPAYFENCSPHIKNEAALIKSGRRNLSTEPVDGIKFYLVTGHFKFITPESTDETIKDILKHTDINGQKLPEDVKITIIRLPKSTDTVNN
jgi:hypothetical protein